MNLMSLSGALRAILACAAMLAAQALSAEPVRVATRQVPPFVLRENGKLTGFSIELWEAIAREAGMESGYVEAETLPALLETISDGKADLAIAAISITSERESKFEFSQPMFDAGLKILTGVDREAEGSGNFLSVLASRPFLELLSLVAALILLPVPFIWLLDRHRHDGVVKSTSFGREILKSLWWSSSTLAGQATHMPTGFGGRAFAVIWMFVSVVFVSYFTANVTANLTVKQLERSISGPKDLIGKKVATVAGSTAAAYLATHEIKATEFPDFSSAVGAVETGAVRALVYDAPVLMYYAAHAGKGRVETIGPVFRPENYGILFPTGSAWRKPVNAALLKLQESGQYRALYRKWFVADQKADD